MKLEKILSLLDVLLASKMSWSKWTNLAFKVEVVQGEVWHLLPLLHLSPPPPPPPPPAPPPVLLLLRLLFHPLSVYCFLLNIFSLSITTKGQAHKSHESRSKTKSCPRSWRGGRPRRTEPYWRTAADTPTPWDDFGWLATKHLPVETRKLLHEDLTNDSDHYRPSLTIHSDNNALQPKLLSLNSKIIQCTGINNLRSKQVRWRWFAIWNVAADIINKLGQAPLNANSFNWKGD